MILKRDDVQKTAEKLVAKGKIEAAIKEYRKILAKRPTDINILNRVGDLYARVQQNEEAVSAYAQIATKYAADGFYVKAIAVYKKIQRIDNGAGLETHEKLAELYQKQGLTNDARSHYQVLADHYQRNQDVASAIKVYRKLVDNEPHDPSHHAKLAELYEQSKNLSKALEEYQVIAELMLAQGHWEEAAQVYRKAMSVDATDLEFLNKGLTALMEAGHPEAAQTILEAARKHNPQAQALPSVMGMPSEPEIESFQTADDRLEPTSQAPVSTQAGALGTSGELGGMDAMSGMDDMGKSDLGGLDAMGMNDDLGAGGELGGGLDATFTDTPGEESARDAVSSTGSSKALEEASPDPEPASENYEEFVLDFEDEEPPSTLIAPPSDVPEGDSPHEALSSSAAGGEIDLAFDEVPEASPIPAPEEAPPGLRQPEKEVDWAFEPEPDLETTPGLAAAADEPQLEPESLQAAAASGEPGRQPMASGGAIDEGLLERTAAELQPTAVRREDDLLAEAEVFIKYGLNDKATDRLLEVLEINARHVGAYSQLIPLVLQREDQNRVASLAVQMLQAAREQGALDSWNEVQAILIPAGYTVDGDNVQPPSSATAPVASTESQAPAPGGIEPPLSPAPQPALSGIPESVAPEGSALPGGELDVLEGSSEVQPPPELEAWELDSAGEAETALFDEEIELEAPMPGQGELAPDPEILASPGLEGAAGIDDSQELETLDTRVPDLSEPTAAPGTPAAAPPAQSIPSLEVPQELELVPPAEAGGPGGMETPAPGTEPPSAEAFTIDLPDVDLPVVPPPEIAPEPATPLPQAGAAATPAAGTTPLPPMEPPAVQQDPLDQTDLTWLDDQQPAKTEAKSSESNDNLFDAEDAFFDLASELEDELDESTGLDEAAAPTPREPSLEEIVEGFKRGVEENLSPEDSDTHYNLGIAYREMGLLDEAIGEFQIAAKDPQYLVESGSMLGLCLEDKGLPELAIKWYRKALSSPNINEKQTLAMLYDLGNAYISLNDSASAYKTFIEIYGINTHYRDVVGKLQGLSGQRQPG